MYSRDRKMDAMKNSWGQAGPTRDLLVEDAVLPDVVPQIAPRQQVHDQVQVLPVLERIHHVHDEPALDRDYGWFISDRMIFSFITELTDFFDMILLNQPLTWP